MTTSRTTNAVRAFLVFLQPLLALAQQGQQAAPWHWAGPWHMSHGVWGFGWIFPVFMFLMMIACAVMVFRVLRSGPRPHCCGSRRAMDRDPAHAALEILHERFARGEIQAQEYEEKRATLLSGGAGNPNAFLSK